MPNQNQDSITHDSSNHQPLPPPPLEFGPEEVTPPTFPRTAVLDDMKQEPPADVKEMNRAAQIPLFVGMGILAIVLFSLLFYFIV